MSKIVLVYENTEIAKINNPKDNERIAWITLLKDNGEKQLFFPQKPNTPSPNEHIMKLARKHKIQLHDIIWIDIEIFEKLFQDKKFTEGPHREVPSGDPRVPGVFYMGWRSQVWGMIDDKLYYSMYPTEDK